VGEISAKTSEDVWGRIYTSSVSAGALRFALALAQAQAGSSWLGVAAIVVAYAAGVHLLAGA
jgi:hypothetical protein